MVRQGLPQLAKAGARWLAIWTTLLVSAEAATRVDDAVVWKAPLLSLYSEDRLMIRDSLGTRGRPNYRFEKWRMNNAGFRGSDIQASPASGISRVVVLGASETFGLQESEGAEYPARMQVTLGSLAPGRFEVINAALPGMGLPAMTSYYQQFVARFRPKFVVVYPTPTFYLLVDPLSSVPEAPRQGWNKTKSRAFSEVFQSRLVTKARDALKQLVPTTLLTWGREWQLRRIRAKHEPRWVWDSVPAERMALFQQHLERMVRTVQASGAMVILATHTNRYLGLPPSTVHRDRLHLVNLMAKDYPRATTKVMVGVDTAANSIIRRIARDRNVLVVEVEGRIPPRSRYFFDYSHFTDEGADIMARLLAAALVAFPGESTARTMAVGGRP